MGVFYDDDKKYSGAGALVIEDYYRRDGSIEPCIILVRNTASNTYTDFGGTYEAKHKTLEVTASTELLEESGNLIYVAPHIVNKLKSIDLDVSDGTLYKSYIIKINGISKKHYHHNLKIMNNAMKHGFHIPRYWRETNDICHIPIKNINFSNLTNRGKISLIDIDGKQVLIQGRVKYVLFNVKSVILEKIRDSALKTKMIINNSDDWKNGTYTFILN